jgi:hypothetical protein
MRRLLKAMLRGYGVVCERITAVGTDGSLTELPTDRAEATGLHEK